MSNVETRQTMDGEILSGYDERGQFWFCDHCSSTRMWGFGYPHNREPKQLRCDKCRCVTKHLFARTVAESIQ